jgi:uncharacterized protein
MEKLYFSSGALKLEGALESPKGKGPFPAGVVAHPHPNFGGSMHNNVVFALSNALVESGFVSLCFNFRGVGRSQGQYGEISGEADDILAAFEFLKSRTEVLPGPVVLCGYSFGGLAALHALVRGLEPRALILVSPMIPEGGVKQDRELSKILPLKFPALILSGEQDQFFDNRFYQPLLTGSKAPSELARVKDADHFWSGFEGEVTARSKVFLDSLPKPS